MSSDSTTLVGFVTTNTALHLGRLLRTHTYKHVSHNVLEYCDDIHHVTINEGAQCMTTELLKVLGPSSDDSHAEYRA